MGLFVRSKLPLLGAGIAVLVVCGYLIWNYQDAKAPGGSYGNPEPRLRIDTLAEGLSNVWDVAQAPDETLYYTERDKRIGVIFDGAPRTIHTESTAVASGEGGMLGMALDPGFATNRLMYVCFNTLNDVRVVRYRVANDNLSLSKDKDIITGMPANPSGRHSGCRPRFDHLNRLWVGTGDAARSENPQSQNSLGGKILRVDRDGNPVEGNMAAPFDLRIFSYGHRNVQGIALFRSPRAHFPGYSAEHGSSRDDEVNLLVPGNFGWDPGPGYDESVNMTDLTKYPDAIPAVWSSGSPTIAVSGAAILEGSVWQGWENSLALAVQKGRHVRLIIFDESGREVKAEKEILNDYGRIRSLVLGSNDELFMTTDNGSGRDKIIRLYAE